MRKRMAVQMLAGLLSGMITLGTVSVTGFAKEADEGEIGVMPDYGYQKVYETHDIADWVHEETLECAYLGDFDRNGEVTLEDAQYILEAALGIRAADERVCFCSRYAENHQGVNLNDALNTLQMALKIKEQRIIELPHIYTVFESLEFNKWDLKEEGIVFSGKEDLLAYARAMNNAELEQAVEKIPEREFYYHQALLICRSVYASQIADVEVTEVACKKGLESKSNGMDVEGGCFAVVEDGNQDVLDQRNQQYLSLVLMDAKTVRSTYEERYGVCLQDEISGGEKARLHIFHENGAFEQLKLEMPVVIRSVAELNAFKEKLEAKDKELADNEWPISAELWDALDKDEAYFIEKTLIIDGEKVSSMRGRRKLTWEKDGNAVRFQIENTKLLPHVMAPDAVYVYNFNVLEAANSLVDDCEVQMQHSVVSHYYDYAPQQSTYVLNDDKNVLDQAFKVTNEQDRREAREILEFIYNDHESSEFQAMLAELERIDLSRQDTAIVITGIDNHILREDDDVPKKPQMQETMYIALGDSFMDAYLSEQGISYYDEQQLVTFLQFDKGQLGNRLRTATQARPQIEAEYNIVDITND